MDPARPRRTVIVGGVAGGMSAATRLRRLDAEREIVVLERSGAVSYANCGLPYHLGGAIPDRGALELQTPDGLRARFGLDVRVLTEAVAIDPDAQTVEARDLRTGAIEHLAYDELVLAPGASPRRPASIASGARVESLRTLDDLDRIAGAVDALAPGAPVVVIGAGHLGIEIADNLHQRGLAVTVVQRGTHLLPVLDAEMTAPLADHLLGLGIDVRLGVGVAEVGADEVRLATGLRLPAELVIAAMGAEPETALARGAGIGIGASGGIAVDGLHRTGIPNVFAIGDAAEKVDAIDLVSRPVALAGLANRHGRHVADIIAGRDATPARPALGTSIVDVAGITAASVGWNEQVARSRGRDVRVLHSHPLSHAGYYPGARPMSLKLVVDAADDRILGAQAVGTDGVARRIDVIAVAMSAGMRASALADLELAYAPQYGSAKDPVNQLGYLARNRASGGDRTIQWHELDAAVSDGAVLLDVRAKAQLDEGLIPGAAWIPVEELRSRHAEFAGRPIVVHCRVGQGAHTAARLLAELGHDVRNLDGGYLTWRDGMRAIALADDGADGRRAGIEGTASDLDERSAA
ncbi:NADPH-dependent 2,4-dienoyl-CoA reductase, sulfur reductase [Agromyces sp. CF514]|uniref:FAD-dependent oxidoreductase n=1 Tax=Agromyces sp. CF514 TaxID=1881031 RepID=UPI0008EA6436|nr:FAD-dependent oxidoreductase [Agromyces sp. CF514]SFR69295.1 NADPH-dependent 2,4-dienoyl-CoA reductase, sulfur reductase [Agromyces sp. CF514]